jgi:hypothetical protein
MSAWKILSRLSGSELDRWDYSVRLVSFEVVTSLEVEQLGENDGRELVELVVVSEHAVVVELPRVCDATLGRSQLFLKGEKVRVCLQVWICLAQSEQLTEGSGEQPIRLGLCPRRIWGFNRRIASTYDGLERFTLMGGVALDGFDEVRDEIDSSFQLDVDLRPGIANLVAPTDQSVVTRNQHDNEYNYDDDHDDYCDHEVESTRQRRAQSAMDAAITAL